MTIAQRRGIAHYAGRDIPAPRANTVAFLARLDYIRKNRTTGAYALTTLGRELSLLAGFFEEI
jgi:hypothetical protein